MSNDDTPGAGQAAPPHRANYEQRDDGVYYCEGLHDNGMPCEWQKLTVEQVVSLRHRLQQAETERVRMQCERDSARNDHRSLMADYRVLLAERDRLKAELDEEKSLGAGMLNEVKMVRAFARTALADRDRLQQALARIRDTPKATHAAEVMRNIATEALGVVRDVVATEQGAPTRVADEARALLESWKARGYPAISVDKLGILASSRLLRPGEVTSCAVHPIDSPEALAAVVAMLRAQKKQFQAQETPLNPEAQRRFDKFIESAERFQRGVADGSIRAPEQEAGDG